jgi:hypothetical protein
MPVDLRIPRAVASKLGYYVYVYVDPSDESVFYVGKGRGSRALSHLNATERRKVTSTIRRIRQSGFAPHIDILAHNLPSEQVAFAVEAAAIDLIGIHNLTNEVRGHTGPRYGRMPLSQLIAHYTKKKVVIKEPSILIRINKLYHFGMTAVELYDATRSAWKVGEKKHQARYAMAVYEGVVREVYEITGWLQGGSTFAAQNLGKRKQRPGRWEFVGTLADDSVRKRYVNSYVGHRFRSGAQNPITYVNIDR